MFNAYADTVITIRKEILTDEGALSVPFGQQEGEKKSNKTNLQLLSETDPAVEARTWAKTRGLRIFSESRIKF
jgi:hypothetical protein